MPAYDYVCSNCQIKETRIAGIDDHTVICDECGQIMVRQADVETLMASYSRDCRKSSEQAG